LDNQARMLEFDVSKKRPCRTNLVTISQ